MKGCRWRWRSGRCQVGSSRVARWAKKRRASSRTGHRARPQARRRTSTRTSTRTKTTIRPSLCPAPTLRLRPVPSSNALAPPPRRPLLPPPSSALSPQHQAKSLNPSPLQPPKRNAASPPSREKARQPRCTPLLNLDPPAGCTRLYPWHSLRPHPVSGHRKRAFGSALSSPSLQRAR